MPWYFKIYLILYSVLVVGGIYDDFEKKRSPLNYIFGILSGAFIFTFVYAYFYQDVAEAIGLWVIPMSILGIAWEFYITTKEVSHFSEDPELTEKENILTTNFAMLLVNLFVVPGYFIGVILSFKAIRVNL